MSAIWGLVSLSDTIADAPFTEEQLRCMEAPYHQKCQIDCYQSVSLPQIYTGCGIQHITKESQKELLPIHDKERKLIFNADCILDNREELISQVDATAEEPDGTLMYLAYLKWGIQCASHFRGLFSFVVYDLARNTLYLASDQLSSRSLYYYREENTIVFSTLIEPIRKVFPKLSFNEYYFKDYLTAPGLMPNISANETPYENLYKLNPGTYLTITPSGIQETSYWNPSMDNKFPKCRNASEYRDAFFQLYDSCVRDAMRCQGNVGVSMSSGLDSATVGVLAARTLQKQGRELMAYTYVPYLKPTLHSAKNNVLDETDDVRLIHAMYPNIVPHFLNNQGRNCIESLSDSLSILEFPFKAYVNLPNLREIYDSSAKDGCKVLLTGQCGNSTVSHGYIDDVLYDLYENKHYLKFLRFLNHYSKTVKESRKQAFLGCLRYFQYSKKQYRSTRFRYQPTNSFLSEEILENYPMQHRYQESGNQLLVQVPISGAFFHRSLYKAAIYTYMGELETKMGLYYGIVIRDATKDMRMMSFCYHLPYEYFAWNGTPRWLIRDSFQELLPSKLLNNWMRYGVQNADYISRITRDLPKLVPEFKGVMQNIRYSNWLRTEDISCFLDVLEEISCSKEDSLDFQRFDDFCYLYILQLYVNANSPGTE